jgi:hypothetical protein
MAVPGELDLIRAYLRVLISAFRSISARYLPTILQMVLVRAHLELSPMVDVGGLVVDAVSGTLRSIKPSLADMIQPEQRI